MAYFVAFSFLGSRTHSSIGPRPRYSPSWRSHIFIADQGTGGPEADRFPIAHGLLRATKRMLGGQLSLLDRLIADARALTSMQPARWSVSVGGVMYPTHGLERYADLERTRLLRLRDDLEAIVAAARARGLAVHFDGD